MLNQYFGQYLLNKGIITAENLQEVLNVGQSIHIKIGVLAINAGYMTARQVEEVHGIQYQRDRRFGEIALEKGYLTGAQVGELLNTQKQKTLTLSQAVIDKGFLSLEQLEAALDGYWQQAKLSGEHFPAPHDTDYGAAVRIANDFSAAGDAAELLYEYTSLLLRNIMRFLNEVPVPGTYIPDETLKQKWIASQSLFGDVRLFTGIAMEDSVLLEMARRYSGEELLQVDELACDSVAEFLNVNNGIFCVNLSENGLETDMLPQQIQRGILPDFALSPASIKTSFGDITVLLAVA